MTRCLALLLAGALAVLAACGSDAQHGAPLAPYTASNPTISATPSDAPWVSMTDRRSGVRFEFPHHKKPVFRHGSPSSWGYSWAVPGGNDDGDQLTVTLTFFDGGIPALPAILDNLTAAAKQAQMPDARHLRTHATRVGDVPAQTGALEFTSMATQQKAYWLITEFATKGYVVAAQVYSLSAPGELAARKQQVRQLLRQLVGSIRVP